MIFFGDISIPNGRTIKIEEWPFTSEELVANLEGSIIDDPENTIGVYNSDETLDVLRALNIKAVSLANNHIQDRSRSFNHTQESLKKYGIQFFGANRKEDNSTLWKEILIGTERYYFLSGAAYITGVTRKRNSNDSFASVNEIEYDGILNALREIRKKDKEAKIICLFHWGCELELYPYPADREFAKKLIDEGANAVIGCHSHCIQGLEIYKNKPIVYGLGNFLFYQGYYWEGKLVFPSISEDELGFEYTDNTVKCHWFKYDRNKNVLRYINTTSVEDELVKKFTPYSGMSSDEYAIWFKHNRRKRKLLPIWYYNDGIKSIWLKKRMLDFREFIVRTMKSLKIKGGPH